MTTTGRAYDTWHQKLNRPGGHYLTKSEISAFARRVTAVAQTGYPASGATTSLSEDEARTLLADIRSRPVNLTPDHTEQGVTWLDRHGVKALGELAADVLSRFRCFTWDGEVEYHSNGYRTDTTPVWTVHTTDGRAYKYWYASGWRDGRKGSDGRMWEVRS